MYTDDELDAIAADIERQNEGLKELETTLRALGDVELAVPKAFFEDLEDATAPRAQTPAMPVFGIRG